MGYKSNSMNQESYILVTTLKTTNYMESLRYSTNLVLKLEQYPSKPIK